MARPLLPLNIGQLEAMFAQLPDDLPQLEILLTELQVRSTPKAFALRAKVSKAIAVLKGDDLFGPGETTTGTSEVGVTPTVATQTASPARLTQTSPSTGEAKAVPPQQQAALKPAVTTTTRSPAHGIATPTSLANIGLEQACAFFKIKSSERWEVIEELRRDIVGRSSPSAMINLSENEKIVRRSEAKFANAAYLAILRARCDTSSTP